VRGTRKGIQIGLAMLMIVLVAAGVTSAGCGGGGGAGPVGNETVVLKYSQPHPALPGVWGSSASEGSVYYWEDAIETVTEGRVDIEIYTSEILNKQELAFDALVAGVADIAWCVDCYAVEWTPLEVLWYLALDIDSCEENYIIHSKLYEEHFLPEFEARGLINITTLGREQFIVFSPHKPINRLEDFEGLTVLSAGPTLENLMSKLGSLSIALQWQDCYEALAKGTLNCAFLDITLPIAFRWHETGDPGYVIDCGGIGNAQPHYNAHEDLLDRLRPEDAYAVLKLTDYWLGIRGSQWSDATNILYLDEVPKVGMEYIEWSESEKERLRELKRESYQWAVDWMETEFGKGEQATALLDAILEEIENYKGGGNRTPGNPNSMTEQWQVERLAEFGWEVSDEAWQELVGPDGHWGMDFDYGVDWEPWYEEWWREQNMEHPWYENWKAQHGG
jgi:TRAP-type C4-dicarboxylate transport system substrate-binding protein